MTNEEAKDVLQEQIDRYGQEYDAEGIEALEIAINVLEQQPKTEHWLNVEDRTDWYDATYKCSCCGREIITPYELRNNLYSDYPYCHCGAKMVEPQESEDKG